MMGGWWMDQWMVNRSMDDSWMVDGSMDVDKLMDDTWMNGLIDGCLMNG